jgi:H+/Cl- antiporter ClcA
VGLIGLVLPEALGMGYGWVQVSMGPGLLAIPLWVVLLMVAEMTGNLSLLAPAMIGAPGHDVT